ncbi:hypothetical protein CCHR01_17271 [Colletotrichum chrysophilum]|uniref:Uncharacterized protein n=1 Tax=Colletotrichum chrysophilum TaxID=1836956 RepID=A0AAD9A2V3_9PEZI|nr:hypothetical protein CCHR01_17271 [Colletotrichum chrysophilum]
MGWRMSVLPVRVHIRRSVSNRACHERRRRHSVWRWLAHVPIWNTRWQWRVRLWYGHRGRAQSRQRLKRRMSLRRRVVLRSATMPVVSWPRRWMAIRARRLVSRWWRYGRRCRGLDRWWRCRSRRGMSCGLGDRCRRRRGRGRRLYRDIGGSGGSNNRSWCRGHPGVCRETARSSLWAGRGRASQSRWGCSKSMMWRNHWEGRRHHSCSFNDGRRILRWMGIGLPLGLTTLVALELSLLHELLSLRSETSIVAIGKLSLVRILNGPPLEADINTASNADLLSSLVIVGCLAVCLVGNTINWESCG